MTRAEALPGDSPNMGVPSTSWPRRRRWPTSAVGNGTSRPAAAGDEAGFVSTVSHELRTPLSSVLGYLELLRSGEAGDLSTQQAHMLDVIARNGSRLLALVQDLLITTRIDAGTLKLTAAPVAVGLLSASTAV